MNRLQVVVIDLNKVTSAEDLHYLLKDALAFPDWYGCNWDAFWDAITGLVQMPLQLQISGWDAFSRRLPRDAELMQKCLANMQVEYPQLAADLLFE
ncbi:barstar family protein [Pseudomonas rubra]|uniref:Barstar family protein n=1 Tax=Pseudomonas rubra TaxID=2942627 RepID=A0ABT5PA54_9PSED|nr:barstar family protein [Pseudomonas rubra]MDD1015066.1 barstar family protein [Pseudomonas rubra]MDD1038599.1 barstar family protein [Pseudomonas rubra]MDD1154709.1 barstar family protein [Pseudomonas rubra]